MSDDRHQQYVAAADVTEAEVVGAETGAVGLGPVTQGEKEAVTTHPVATIVVAGEIEVVVAVQLVGGVINAENLQRLVEVLEVQILL